MTAEIKDVISLRFNLPLPEKIEKLFFYFYTFFRKTFLEDHLRQKHTSFVIILSDDNE